MLLSLSLKERTQVPPELLALCASVRLVVGIVQHPQRWLAQSLRTRARSQTYIEFLC